MVKRLVSIIINNYNYSQFIRQAIDSALSQNYPNTEVIVVDDGSTDNSPEIINSYGTQIIPILKNNGGQASAFNVGFQASKGEIIIFLDADDYLFPKTAQEVVAIWKPGLAIVQYRLELVDTVGKFLDIYPCSEIQLDSGNVLPILLSKGSYSGLVTSGNAFSREALTKILPMPEMNFRICADGYITTLIPFYGQILSIEQPLGGYRKHTINAWSLSGRNKIQAEQCWKSIKHDFLKFEILAQKANEFGYAVTNSVDSRNYFHLRCRIASLRLDPRNHPVPYDSRLGLAWKGCWATWKYSGYSSWKRKLILSFWFLWVAFMPQGLAEPVINWLLMQQSRPKNVDKIVKKIRWLFG
ncbi:glycosyltransferase [Aetokthonos hydrillicola Thurmond2011]|jgi:glycosyltransferase involved in cell wall biosynthesis|uniref:Glycosyltransferase n=1 Tax=Aetokthonos hydrillicola Thurmond2011 TaxID=2712845 RepID=A0AAP5M9U2_9CYAN|nr:glycosyltransferase family A protein [Aetokthonos hydrillicola]MBO3459831.1 glycosyltransferase family 2 protein [Aetokthonos hydrillicola CCALA 1050]MBW4584524.1 glycosyltransferase [Aetokthonos hydrillicola CCALA 1050]MDR9895068.1 glycosyltransferase [Aetokthonos hydrillicola Thurmond2011]